MRKYDMGQANAQEAKNISDVRDNVKLSTRWLSSADNTVKALGLILLYTDININGMTKEKDLSARNEVVIIINVGINYMKKPVNYFTS